MEHPQLTTPYAFTGTLEHARQVAMSALASTNGVLLTFKTEQYGTCELAGRAARTFQQSFTSMRAKSRRIRQRQNGELSQQLDSHIDHPFDGLAAMRNPLPHAAGWEVRIVPAAMVHLGAVITDIATGEVVSDFDPRDRTFKVIFTKMWNEAEAAQREHRKPAWPLTDEEDRWARDYDREWDATCASLGFTSPSAPSPRIPDEDLDPLSLLTEL